MHRFTFARKPAALVVAAAAVLVAAGVAYATIPDGNGVIHCCYEKSDGSLRVIDTAVGKGCSKKEVGLDWSQTGPRGPAGPQGAQGPSGSQGPHGPAGPSGTSHGYLASNGTFSVFISTSPTTIDSIGNLPAGTYVVTSMGTNEQNGDNGRHTCDLTSGGTLLQRTEVVGDELPYALTGAVTLTGPGSIETDCGTDGTGGGNPFVFAAAMTAIRVDSLN